MVAIGKYGQILRTEITECYSWIKANIHFTKEEGLNYRTFESQRFFSTRIFNTKKESQLESLKMLIKIVKSKNL